MIRGKCLLVSGCIVALTMFGGMLNAHGQDACTPDPMITAAGLITIECADLFEAAQAKLRDNFQGIVADDGCGTDLTGDIRIKEIRRVKNNGRYIVPLDLEDIVAKLAANVDAFEAGEYDYTVPKTQKLFHYYFLFNPGVYEVYYYILGDDGQPIDAFRANRKQVIMINSECKGCLGFLSCNSCAGCREEYIPDSIRNLGLKQILADCLLIGVSLLVMLSWPSIRGH